MTGQSARSASSPSALTVCQVDRSVCISPVPTRVFFRKNRTIARFPVFRHPNIVYICSAKYP
ncbi:MAG: hypothetical protein APR55_09520 [Methanolinea sp. SDB]|nr:MAG: hypothetical protein APR55_09520 [Methanolinea sp. SDB]